MPKPGKAVYYYCLGQYFSDVACARAHRPALCYQEKDYSYSELIHWAEGLTELLLEKGCRQGDVIAIGHNKQPLSYALMLAGLRLGVAYVNIDTESPLDRNARILEVSGASLLFFDSAKYAEPMSSLAKKHGCELLMLDSDQLSVPTDHALAEQEHLMAKVDGACIAYVMFTSGSTGVPKGVAVTHQNILHFIAWGKQRFDVNEQDNFANLSPMYFDNSVFDFYVGLFSGASLSPVARELLTKPYDLVPYVAQRCCTLWFSVPSLLIYLMSMKAFVSDALPALKKIVFGGEGYPKVELKKLYDNFSMQAELVNVYGPTECTCICSAHTLSNVDFEEMEGLPTLGYLNSNFDYKIVDEKDRDADTGELCLIGPNVAAGYFNDIARSSTSFETLSEPGRFMKRMYRTGDLVRKGRDGLYFIGRKDNQIKHMGYRIELEEVEHALVKLPQVDQAVVVYQRVHAAYGKLTGFVASTEVVSEKQLLHELSRLLPDYMRPQKLITMEELPKNPNGKVDRQKLSALLDT